MEQRNRAYLKNRDDKVGLISGVTISNGRVCFVVLYPSGDKELVAISDTQFYEIVEEALVTLEIRDLFSGHNATIRQKD